MLSVNMRRNSYIIALLRWPCLLLIGYGIGLKSVGASESLTVMTEQYYPFNYTEEDSQTIKGFATKLLIEILDHAQVSYQIHLVPWARAMQAIDSAENVIVYSMT